VAAEVPLRYVAAILLPEAGAPHHDKKTILNEKQIHRAIAAQQYTDAHTWFTNGESLKQH